ncbi:MAG: FAD-dependent oxidoreductase [Deltaproteobacteria bacterium]|nr:FAD-dependent oxidoreductase [Deltaproteobacteria bacterium]
MILLEPITINNVLLRNRIVMPAMHLNYTPEGDVTEQLVSFYRERSQGGAGLIVVGGCRIDKYSGAPGLIGLDHDSRIPGLKRLVDAVHEHGAAIAVQLYHAGRYLHSGFIGEPAVAPSAIASRFTNEVPRAMTKDDIEETVENYCRAAIRSQEAGFDGVEVLGNTGYLINQFLSAITNTRTDEYGGDLTGRMRFGLELAEAVRSAVGRDFMVQMRLGGNDFMPEGNTLDETLIFARELEKLGIDAFSITGGWHETRVPQLPMEVPRGCYVYLAREVKQTVNKPVIACNRINDPLQAERIIRQGSADMAGFARGLIADPYLPVKLSRGRADQIMPCIACNQGCFDHIFRLEAVACMANPRAGREALVPSVMKADKPKKVIVIGGGPAGLSAAATAAELGHKVELYEKSDDLGGQLNLAGALRERNEFLTLKNALIGKARRSGVEIHTGVEADADHIESCKADAVILASGGRPIMPRIPGIDGSNVVQAWDVLSGKADIGKHAVIIGGGAVGIETGIHIAKTGTLDPEMLHFLFLHQAEKIGTLRDLCTTGIKKVTIIEMLPKIGKDIGVSTRWVELKMLDLYNVQTITCAAVTEITPDGVIVDRQGTFEHIPCETIVIAVGTASLNTLEKTLQQKAMQIFTVGDAASPRKAFEAIREGFDTARRIA